MDNIIYFAIPIGFLIIVFLFFLAMYNRSCAEEYREKYHDTLKAYQNIKSIYDQYMLREKEKNIRLTGYLKKSHERMADNEKKGFKYSHIVNNVPTTKENVMNVRIINDMMKKSESMWRLRIKYRGPVEGGYKTGGVVSKDNSKFFSVYAWSPE